MVIIYGTRLAGVVGRVEGQYAATRFAHVYWLPLLPIDRMWVVEEDGDATRGHAIRWSGKSVLAAYLRTWGLILGGAMMLFAPLAAAIVGGVLVLAGCASWAWRALGEQERHQRELFHAATGSWCDPELLPGTVVRDMRHSLGERWRLLDPQATPQDVARFGTQDEDQRALAYALLRLDALTAPRHQAVQLRELGARLLVSRRRQAFDPQGGPYRA
jgi:hypothetical protein